MGRKEALKPHWEAPKVWKDDEVGDPVFLALTGPFRFEDLWCRDFSLHAGFLSMSKNGTLKAFVALRVSIYYTKQERVILVTG